jgi:hypothetical protein
MSDNASRVTVSGLLPPHFLSTRPMEDLRAYVSDYLKEEIAAEALTENIPARPVRVNRRTRTALA